MRGKISGARRSEVRLGIAGFLLLVTAGRCWPFDIDGYRTGMSPAEVQNVAVAADANMHMVFMASSKEDSRLTSYTAQRLINRVFAGMPTSFMFCNGALATYQKDLTGGFRDFAKLVMQETTLQGTARYEVTNYATSSITGSMLSFTWGAGADAISVTYSVYPANGQLDMLYGERGSRCPN